MFEWVLVRAAERPELEAGEAPPDFLSPHEAQALGRLKFLQRRRKWLLGRWAAKKLLLAALSGTRPGLSAPQLTIENEPSGLPFASLEPGERLPWSLSISHRADLAVAGLVTAAELRLGIDLELVQPRDPVLLRDFFTTAEAEAAGAHQGRDHELAVARTWSAKESVLKALGVGLRLDTRSIQIAEAPPPATTPGWPAGWRPISVAVEPWPSELPRRQVRACWRDEGAFVLSAAVLG